MQAVDWCGDGSVYVVDLALACCALESQSALAVRRRTPVEELPDDARVVVTLSGTLTDAAVPAARAALEAVPGEPVVVAFGACACIGGPYWDSYAVTKGVSQVAEPHHFIAGCPPPPGAFAEIIEEVRRG